MGTGSKWQVWLSPGAGLRLSLLLLPLLLLCSAAQQHEELSFAAKYQRPAESVLIASG